MQQPNIQYTDKQLRSLADMYKNNPSIFSESEKEYLNNVFVSKGSTLEKATDESSILDVANQFASGLVEGFTTIGWADEPQSTSGGIAQSLGHLIGFAPGILAGPATFTAKQLAKLGVKGGLAGLGTTAKISAGLNKFSVPMMAADKVTDVISAVGKKNAAFESLAYLKEGSFGRAALKSALHLGTASAVSSWQEGVDGAMSSFIHGSVAGAAFQGIGQFVNLRKMLHSSSAKQVNTANTAVRALAGSIFTGLPTTLQDQPLPVQIYQYLLGAYFGGTSMPAWVKAASDYKAKVKRENYRTPEKEDEGRWENLTKDAQVEVYRQLHEELGATLSPELGEQTEYGIAARMAQMNILEQSKNKKTAYREVYDMIIKPREERFTEAGYRRMGEGEEAQAGASVLIDKITGQKYTNAGKPDAKSIEDSLIPKKEDVPVKKEASPEKLNKLEIPEVKKESPEKLNKLKIPEVKKESVEEKSFSLHPVTKVSKDIQVRIDKIESENEGLRDKDGAVPKDKKAKFRKNRKRISDLKKISSKPETSAEFTARLESFTKDDLVKAIGVEPFIAGAEAEKILNIVQRLAGDKAYRTIRKIMSEGGVYYEGANVLGLRRKLQRAISGLINYYSNSKTKVEVPPEKLNKLEIPEVKKEVPTETPPKELNKLKIPEVKEEPVETTPETDQSSSRGDYKGIVEETAELLPFKNKKEMMDAIDKRVREIAIKPKKGDWGNLITELKDRAKKNGKKFTDDMQRRLRRHHNKALATQTTEFVQAGTLGVIKRGDMKFSGQRIHGFEIPSYLKGITDIAYVTVYEKPDKFGVKGEHKIGNASPRRFGEIITDMSEEHGYLYHSGRKDGHRAVFVKSLIENNSPAKVIEIIKRVDKLVDSSERTKLRAEAIKDLKITKETYDLMYANNVLMLEKINGGISIEEMYRGNQKKEADFILDPIKLNKRMQLIASRTDKKLDKEIIGGKEFLPTVIINAVQKNKDLESSLKKYGIQIEYDKDGKSTLIYTDVHLDGVAIVDQKDFDAITRDGGHPANAGAAKGALVSANKKEGAILGKYAYFRATDAEHAEMQTNKISVKLYDTAVKQRGLRTAMDWTMGPKGMKYHVDGKEVEPIKYDIPTEDYTVSVGVFENTKTLHKPQRVNMQVLYKANDLQVDTKVFKDYYDGVLYNSVVGDKTQNELYDNYIIKPDSNTLKKIDWDYVGLSRVIDAATNKTSNLEMFESVWRFLGRDMQEYRETLDQAPSEVPLEINADVNEILKSVMGHKPWSIMHKFNSDLNDLQLQNYIRRRALQPIDKYSGKSIGGPTTPYMSNKKQQPKYGQFLFAEDMKQMKVMQHIGGKLYETTLGRLWADYQKTELNIKNSKNPPESLKKHLEDLKWDLTFAVQRTPQDSASGERALMFGGFVKQKGGQIFLHPKDMEYEGGMDLDIDSVKFFQNKSKKYLQELLKVKDEWDSSNGLTSAKENAKQYTEELPKENKGLAGLFDPYTRQRISSGAANGNDLLGFVNNYAYKIHTLYAEVKRNPAYKLLTHNGFEISFKIKDDNGVGIRKIARNLSNITADMGDYAGIVSMREMQREFLEAGFKNITIKKKGGKARELLNAPGSDKILHKLTSIGDLGKFSNLIESYGGWDYGRNKAYSIYKTADTIKTLTDENVFPNSTHSHIAKNINLYLNVIDRDPRLTSGVSEFRAIKKAVMKDVKELIDNDKEFENVIPILNWFSGVNGIENAIGKYKKIHKGWLEGKASTAKMMEEVKVIEQMVSNAYHVLTTTPMSLRAVKELRKNGVTIKRIKDVSAQAKKDASDVDAYFKKGIKTARFTRNSADKRESANKKLEEMIEYKDKLESDVLKQFYEIELLVSHAFTGKNQQLASHNRIKGYMFTAVGQQNEKRLISEPTLRLYGENYNKLFSRPKDSQLKEPVPKKGGGLRQRVTPEVKDVSPVKVSDKERKKLAIKKKVPIRKIKKEKKSKDNPLLSENVEGKNVDNGIKTTEDAVEIANTLKEPMEADDFSKQVVHIHFNDKPNPKVADIDKIPLSVEAKDLRDRLSALLVKHPKLAKNFDNIFHGFTSGDWHGLPRTGSSVNTTTKSDLKNFINFFEGITKGQKVFNVSGKDFVYFPETVAEKLLEFDMEFFPSHKVKVYTKNGTISRDSMKPLSHFGRMHSTVSSLIEWADNDTNDAKVKVSEFFKDVMKLENSSDFFDLAIRTHELENRNQGTGRRFQLYQEYYDASKKAFEKKYQNSDGTWKTVRIIKSNNKSSSISADKLVEKVTKDVKVFFDTFFKTNQRGIKEMRDDKIIYEPTLQDIELTDGNGKVKKIKFRYDSGPMKGLVNLKKAIPRIIELIVNDGFNFKTQDVYDLVYEYTLSRHKIWRGKGLPKKSIHELSDKQYAYEMKKRLSKDYLEEVFDMKLSDKNDSHRWNRPTVAYYPNYFPHNTFPKSTQEYVKKMKESMVNQSEMSDADKLHQSMSDDIRISKGLIEDTIESREMVNYLLSTGKKKNKKERFDRIGSTQRSPSSKSRSTHVGPLPNWTIGIDPILKNVQQVTKSKANILIGLSSAMNIADFNARNVGGKFTKNWSMFKTLYARNSIGYPSVLPEKWLDHSSFPVKNNPWYWLSDQAMLRNMQKYNASLFGVKKDMTKIEEDEFFQKIASFSNMEAKYELMSLLAHSKSGVANIYGGSLNTAINAGLGNFFKAQSLQKIRDIIPPDKDGKVFESMADVTKWVEIHGATESHMTDIIRRSPSLRTAKMKAFLDEASRKIKKDPSLSDFTLYEIAKKHGLSQNIVDKAAYFMRTAERKLRRDAFIAHYLQAMKVYEASKASFRRDDPWLIDMAKKGVKATQFIYNNANRPMFSGTSLGRVYSRFQLFAWNSVRFRNNLRKIAGYYGYDQSDQSMRRLNRMITADMIAFALAMAFPMSMFDSAMPPPYQWMQDTSTLLFGDEKSRDRAFFGTLPGPLAPLQAVSPPVGRLLLQPLGNLLKGDWHDFSSYQIWTWFPFGRISRDAIKLMDNPVMAVERITGVPLHGIQRYKKEHIEADSEES